VPCDCVRVHVRSVFHNKPEHDMVFMSVLGIADPLRKEVPAAVNTCQQAGIRVVMVTGDHLITATSIARQCNILPRSYTTPAAPISTVSSRRDLLSPSALSARVKDTRVMEGFDFRSLVAAVTAAQAAADANPDDATLASEAADMKQQLNMLVDRICVLARSSPKDKAVLVQLLKERKEVVGVTGDGTNDAPALLEADVGLAMGIAGTDVAKEAANIVILDDNFFSTLPCSVSVSSVSVSFRFVAAGGAWCCRVFCFVVLVFAHLLSRVPCLLCGPALTACMCRWLQALWHL